jgi:GTPase SAR1 family protein
MATTLDASEQLENASGKLGLSPVIADLNTASQNLSSEVFRLLVLGDMKRGKSTFLNALMGENLLPTDVNPCTAVLTILRYGPEKRVTVHFNDDRAPETLSFEAFKQRYTIRPDQAKKLEDEGTLAFPNVDYAVVEYPLALLEKGVEIVDSPGLNDTEARNQLTLDYVNSCHAILFVLSATQQFTLSEQRYLDNYIKDRGLTVFFLINAWDEIQNRLVDPDDEAELQRRKPGCGRCFAPTWSPIASSMGKICMPIAPSKFPHCRPCVSG